MDSERNTLIITGSPKPAQGASATLANYVAESLSAQGWQTETQRAYSAVRTAESRAALCAAFDAASVIVLVFPLYVDSLPAALTETLVLLARHARTSLAGPPKRLLALCQCGFPEAYHNETALDICRLFCRDAGIEWAGGLALGGGGILAGGDLKKLGGMVRNIVAGLDLALGDLAAGRPVTPEAAALLARPTMPRWLYIAGGNLGWWQLAHKNGVLRRLSARPYAR